MTLIQSQERRLISPLASPILLTRHPKHALVPRYKRFKTISSSHSSSDSSTSAISATTTTPSIAASIRRVLNLPPEKKPSTHSTTQGADQRYRLFLDQWDKGFMEAQEDPEGYFAEIIYGEIPRELEGTLFRNGPGKFTLGGKRIPHPYDGDGLVASIAFKNGTAFFRSRFVQTPEYKAEAAADTVLFRGTFATQRSGGSMANAGDLYVKNTSNTNVIAYGDRLWTLFEAGQPFRLNPKTLDTIGPELLDGLFKAGLPFDLGSKENNSVFAILTRLAQGAAAPAASAALSDEQVAAGGTAVTAHPHICPSTGRLVTFSYCIRPIVPSSPNGAPFVTDFTFYELENDAENTGKMRCAATREYTLPGFAFLHDFALTENYYVIFQNPVTVENAPYMLGQAPAASCVKWVKDTPTYVHVIPRNQGNSTLNSPTNTISDISSSDDVMVFSAPPLFVFHHANAFEKQASTSSTTNNNTASTPSSTSSTDGTTSLVIDSIHYDSLPAVGREALSQQSVDPDAAFTSRLRRVEIDLKSKILKVRCAFDGYLEMPAINPNFFSKKHQFVYGYHSIFEDPQIALAKVDVEGREVELWSPGKNRFALEPRFIPRKRSNSNKNRSSDNNSTAGKADGGGSAGGVFNNSNTNDNSSQEVEVEDDGWLIAQLFDSEAMRSEIVILDAQNLRQGPVAIVALRDPMPSALHACWSDTYYGPLDDDYDENNEGDGGSDPLSKEGNVVPFAQVLGKAEREKLKGSGSVRKSMPTGSSKNGNTIQNSDSEYSDEIKINATNGARLKEVSAKVQSVALVLGALWSSLKGFTEI